MPQVPSTKIPDLDQVVIDALRFFQTQKIPSFPKVPFKRPLVLGSGNAAVTGKIIFQDKDALFADESNYYDKIKYCDGAVLISASGAKDAPVIAQQLRMKKKVILLTNNPHAAACEFASKTIVFPRLPEPYTYNVSTYLGMILSKTKEDPALILKRLQELKIPANLRDYNAFFIIFDQEYHLLKEMLQTKFDELFGPMVVGRIFTAQQARHAKMVIRSDTELFIGIGMGMRGLGGRKKWVMSQHPEVNYAMMMALGYYIIGQIQKQHPPYFKQHIQKYCKEASRSFEEQIDLWVK